MMEYIIIYISADTKEAEERLNTYAAQGWIVICSCSNNRLVLGKEKQQ